MYPYEGGRFANQQKGPTLQVFVQNDTPFYALVVVALHLDTLYIDKLCFRI